MTDVNDQEIYMLKLADKYDKISMYKIFKK
jgi:hypothetical protein